MEEKNTTAPKNDILKKVLRIAGNVLLWIFVVFAALLTVVSLTATRNKNGMSNVFGWSPVTILTDSMKPTFSAGDLLFVRFTDEGAGDLRRELQVGDIIVYEAELKLPDGTTTKGLNAHRIVERIVDDDGLVSYRTKGDNAETNPTADENAVNTNKILGVWQSESNGINGGKISSVGHAINWLRSPTGFLICIVIPLILFFLYELYRFISLIVTSKAKKAVAVDEEEIKRKAIEEYLAAEKAKAAQGADNTDGKA